jgi:hypothetical protein
MKILNVEQGSPDWREARRCKITGTRLDDVMGTSFAQLMLICELIAEEGTEQVKQIRSTPEMERGTAEEPFAIKRFTDQTGKETEQVGICISDDFEYLACSPDRLIKENNIYVEGVEVKNPDTKTAIFYKIASSVDNEELKLASAKRTFLGIPAEYKWQVLNYFLVCETLKKVSFVVHDARFISDDVKLHIIEVERNHPEVQAELEKARKTLVEFREKWLRFKQIALPDNF